MQTKSILFISSLLGLALVAGAGCSSSSSGSATTNEAGTGDDGASTSSSSGGEAGPMLNLACMGGDCDGGACCAMVSISGGFSISSMCAASCTISMLSPQLCATDKDCPTGDTCVLSPLGMGHICQPGGTSSSSGGSSSGGSSSGGSSGGDSGATDSGGTDSGSSSGGSDAGSSDAPAG